MTEKPEIDVQRRRKAKNRNDVQLHLFAAKPVKLLEAVVVLTELLQVGAVDHCLVLQAAFWVAVKENWVVVASLSL
jgi:hypothetical protein